MNEQACETKNIKYHFMSRLIIPIEIMIVLSRDCGRAGAYLHFDHHLNGRPV